MIYTTLNKIRAHKPCAPSWEKLLKALGKKKADDARLSFASIEKICGVDDALWATRACPEHARAWRLLAVWCARQVQHLLTDQRSLDALDVAERFANGEATAAELLAAESAAESAAWSAAESAAESAAWSAARSAAESAAGSAAESAAWSAARSAVCSAVCSAAESAAWSAAESAAESAAWSAAESAAWSAARSAQREQFLAIVSGGAP